VQRLYAIIEMRLQPLHARGFVDFRQRPPQRISSLTTLLMPSKGGFTASQRNAVTVSCFDLIARQQLGHSSTVLAVMGITFVSRLHHTYRARAPDAVRLVYHGFSDREDGQGPGAAPTTQRALLGNHWYRYAQDAARRDAGCCSGFVRGVGIAAEKPLVSGPADSVPERMMSMIAVAEESDLASQSTSSSIMDSRCRECGDGNSKNIGSHLSRAIWCSPAPSTHARRRCSCTPDPHTGQLGALDTGRTAAPARHGCARTSHRPLWPAACRSITPRWFRSPGKRRSRCH
jgi:hypothetical protein